jgi:hypothetical protein
MKVLVCGGRKFRSFESVEKGLARIYGIKHLVHGGAPGTDTLTGDYAWKYKIPCTIYWADWAKYGNSAGPIRNAQMLKDSKPDLVVAFPGGSGTAHMVKIAKERGVKVIEYKLSDFSN